MRRLRWLGLSVLVALAAPLAIGWFSVLTTRYSPDGKEWKASSTCRELDFAVWTYRDHAANPGHRLPASLGDLIHPPWGGPSLYRYGDEEPRDPWGNLFRMEHRRTPDERDYLLVWTIKPDGTKISQFGIGRRAEPTW